MIERIKDEGKFICNVISVTGKLLKQVEFDSLEKACKYKEEMSKKNTIERVEIFTPNNTPVECTDKSLEDADTVKVLYFNSKGEFEHEVEKDKDVAMREYLSNQKLCARKSHDKDLYVGYKKYETVSDKGFLVEVGIYRGGFEVEDGLAYVSDLGRDGSNYQNDIIIAGKKGKSDIKLGDQIKDARAYIGEYIDEFYERYKGVSVYKKPINNIEYEFTAQFLDKDLKAKTAEEIEEKIDKAVEAYVKTYSKDFTFEKAGK